MNYVKTERIRMNWDNLVAKNANLVSILWETTKRISHRAKVMRITLPSPRPGFNFVGGRKHVKLANTIEYRYSVCIIC